MGGSDAASPRYIFTHLSPIARLLFPEVDDMVRSFCCCFISSVPAAQINVISFSF